MILAIDQGTTGTTCLVVDDELRPVGHGYREIRQHFPQPGWVEHDPKEIWDFFEKRRYSLFSLGDGGAERIESLDDFLPSKEGQKAWTEILARPSGKK